MRHRQFWLGLTGALGTFAVALAGLTGHGDSAQPLVDAVQAAVTAILGLLALLGVVVDPTTAGTDDSDQAMLYEEPKPKIRF